MKHLLAMLVEGQSLDREQAVAAFEQIMSGEASPAQTASLLSLIQAKGASVDELVGAASVMRDKAAHVRVPEGLTAIDTCGTGGDHAGTFNISTAAAIVAAAAGRPHDVCVAKHGNRSVTSNSGSSQVLETLGVKLQVSGDTLTKALDEAGICFCFAPAHHPAMKHAAPVRADLGFRTLFNLVGPLTNPAGASRQVIGVFSPKLTGTLGEVLAELGCDHALVVHGQIPSDDGHVVAGLDELSSCGMSQATEVRGDNVETYDVDPTTLGLSFGHPSALRVDDPTSSAAKIESVLAGEHGPSRDIVCLNAAAALMVADIVDNLKEGIDLATEAVDNGKARAALDALVNITRADRSLSS